MTLCQHFVFEQDSALVDASLTPKQKIRFERVFGMFSESAHNDDGEEEMVLFTPIIPNVLKHMGYHFPSSQIRQLIDRVDDSGELRAQTLNGSHRPLAFGNRQWNNRNQRVHGDVLLLHQAQD